LLAFQKYLKTKIYEVYKTNNIKLSKMEKKLILIPKHENMNNLSLRVGNNHIKTLNYFFSKLYDGA